MVLRVILVIMCQLAYWRAMPTLGMFFPVLGSWGSLDRRYDHIAIQNQLKQTQKVCPREPMYVNLGDLVRSATSLLGSESSNSFSFFQGVFWYCE